MAQRNLLLNIPYDIPLEIQHMAKEAQLGELCKVYNRDKKDVGIILIVVGSTILGIPSLVLLLLAVFGNMDHVLMLIIGLPFLFAHKVRGLHIM
jgi:uncharacterized membrane protein